MISCFGKGLARWEAGGKVGGVVGRVAATTVSSDDVGRRDVPPLEDAADAAFDDAGFEDICECTIFGGG